MPPPFEWTSAFTDSSPRRFTKQCNPISTKRWHILECALLDRSSSYLHLDPWDFSSGSGQRGARRGKKTRTTTNTTLLQRKVNMKEKNNICINQVLCYMSAVLFFACCVASGNYSCVYVCAAWCMWSSTLWSITMWTFSESMKPKKESQRERRKPSIYAHRLMTPFGAYFLRLNLYILYICICLRPYSLLHITNEWDIFTYLCTGTAVACSTAVLIAAGKRGR